VNFITCHDGFTLNDLVSYSCKHNESNGEQNRDGMDENLSWNCGVEGPSSDPAVEALRERQIKNFAAILLLSQGVPMLLAGDEARRTQQGNNNAYCHDNTLSWFDWTLVQRHAEMVLFFSHMIAFRRRHRSLRRGFFFTGRPDARGVPDIVWYDHHLRTPDWNDPEGRALACTLGATEDDSTIHMIFNMDEADQIFVLPPLERQQHWLKVLDTAAPSPLDVPFPGQEPVLEDPQLLVPARSVVVLIAAGI
jgi:glycogen operon protein